MTAQEKRSSPILLIIAWLIVGLPGAWGVEQTFYKSLDLFRASAHPTTAPTAQPAQQQPGR